ncbi:MAG: hypothetical protein ACJ0Q2_10330 [Candidatus Azotimanducaceae bacterium]
MTYFFIVLAVVFVLTPLLSIFPKKRQREIQKMRALALKSGVIVTINQPMRSKRKIKESFSQALELAKAREKRGGVTYSKRRDNLEDLGGRVPVAWRIEKESDGRWSWRNDFRSNGCESFRRWIEKSVIDLPQDTQFVEEQNGFISLTWLEKLPESEKLVIDFLDDCANFNFE